MTRPRRARTAAAIVVAAVVVAGVVGVLMWTGSQQESPEAVARAWLRAIAEGDDDAARAAMTAPAEALDVGDAAERPSEPTVREVRINGDTAEADVSFALAGDVHEASVTLAQTPDGWLIGADGLGDVEISTSLGDSVTIGETVIPAGGIRLLPGIYDVAAAPRNYLDGAASVSVVPGGMQAVAIDAAFNDAALGAVREALTDHLDACTQPSAAVPDSCGLRVPWPADIAVLERIAYRIERRPDVQLTDDGGFAATGGVVVATATGTGRDGSPAAVTYRDDAWAVRGTIAVTGEQIRLDVL
ncbi:hypothetical protein QSU92_01950 [Microbacterium sp. ET2]|uniref:hypothetical protein n=1 Tax=Microbacterium albipurpureum TaxID=3050384 RepID=UPI00259C8991|nr:hypothetical protein [Microbacterium sp. ET2 (Ac-2212)]WJL96000.1 hypothetical protein QSU92_01950 [Microbacterium sp. ET2 (Ac-2212)]